MTGAEYVVIEKNWLMLARQAIIKTPESETQIVLSLFKGQHVQTRLM